MLVAAAAGIFISSFKDARKVTRRKTVKSTQDSIRYILETYSDDIPVALYQFCIERQSCATNWPDVFFIWYCSCHFNWLYANEYD